MLVVLGLFACTNALVLRWQDGVTQSHPVVVRIEGELTRTADLEVGWARDGAGDLTVAKVTPTSPAGKAGLQVGDVIRRIAEHTLRPRAPFNSLLWRIKDQSQASFDVERNGQTVRTVFMPAAAPLEQNRGVETIYGVLESSDGLRLRSIVTRPLKVPGRLPAILFVQWLSCDPVDGGLADDDGWRAMLKGLVERSGMVVWRTEKAGVGDSEGDCEALDWDTEIRHHREAYQALLRLPYVDPNRVFIIGGSIGARMAPLVAEGQAPAGFVTWGGGSVTWFEYVMGHNRYFSVTGGTPPGSIGPKLLREATVLTDVFLRRKSPEELNDAERAIWAGMPRVNPVTGLLYGRSHRWHQQAARAEWVQVMDRQLAMTAESHSIVSYHRVPGRVAG